MRHIQDQYFAEDDGLPGRILIQLCLERFSPDLQDLEAIKAEKKDIEETIRLMVQESMLQPVKKDNKVIFRLDPFYNIKDKMNPGASQPSEDPQSTQEALEALERETSPDVAEQDVDEQIDEDLDQQLAAQLEDSMYQMDDQTEEEVDMPQEQHQNQVDDGMVNHVNCESQAAEEACRHAEKELEAERAESAEAASKLIPIDL